MQYDYAIFDLNNKRCRFYNKIDFYKFIDEYHIYNISYLMRDKKIPKGLKMNEIHDGDDIKSWYDHDKIILNNRHAILFHSQTEMMDEYINLKK